MRRSRRRLGLSSAGAGLFVVLAPSGRTRHRRLRSVDRSRPIASERRRRARSSAELNPAPPCSSISTARNCSSFRLPCGAAIPRSSRMARRSWLIRELSAPRPTGLAIDEAFCAVELVLALQFPTKRISRPWVAASRDPLAVAIVVLLGLDVGPDIFGRHQPDIVAVGGEHAAEMMSLATGLHPDNARPEQSASPASPCDASQPRRTHPAQPRCRRSCRGQCQAQRYPSPASSSDLAGENTTPEGGRGHSIKLPARAEGSSRRSARDDADRNLV